MKKILMPLLLVIAAVAVYWFGFRKTETIGDGPKQQAIVAQQHSAAFNSGIDQLMNQYFVIKDAFVNADTLAAKQAVQQFTAAADELKKDSSAIYESALAQLNDIKTNAESIARQTDITEMRKDFWTVSENIYPFLKTVHYEGKNLYWQNCPMAFGEDKGANWISNSEEIVNPYLGKNHPEYKGTMLHCGEVKDTIKAQ
jgi:hypothetical protein